MATRRVRLTSVGDELALVLDQATLDEVGYTLDTVVELRVEAGSLVIAPVRGEAPLSDSSLATLKRQD
jgi:antitoxin component of MazEF toxin-antitoxin module